MTCTACQCLQITAVGFSGGVSLVSVALIAHQLLDMKLAVNEGRRCRTVPLQLRIPELSRQLLLETNATLVKQHSAVPGDYAHIYGWWLMCQMCIT